MIYESPDREVTDVDQRLAQVVGDRRCAACRYNLRGQPIVRERHYGLVIVRCPECSTVASLEEYPLLSRTTRRWRNLLAISWMLLIPLSLLITGVVCFIGINSLWYRETDLGEVLAREYVVWREAQIAAGNPVTAPPAWFPATTPGTGPTTPPGWVERSWVRQLDQMALIRSTGGWVRNLNPQECWSIAAYSIWLLWFGLFFGALLSRTSRWITLAIVALGAGGVVLVFDGTATGADGWLASTFNFAGPGPWVWAQAVAIEWTRPMHLRIVACFAWLLLTLGILLYRPLTSIVLCLTIQPGWGMFRETAGKLPRWSRSRFFTADPSWRNG